ncbi:MAG: VWA-like domain-containing protein, partial [Bacteroidota bacterium]
VDFGWSKDKETMFAYLWQAFLLLPESLQAYWPNCQILRTINGGTIDRDTLSIIIREKDLVNEFPSFLKLAKELQTHLSFRINDRAIPNIYQQRWLEQLSQSSGELPGNLEIFLRSQLATPSTVSWSFLLRNHLKRFLKTSIQTTAKRTSKRYGTVPGLRVQGHAKIGLAIDTSGSVSTASLNLFRNEIKKIADLGHSVEVVEADTRIQRRYNFHGKLPDKLVGGGGTNYDPAIQFFEKKTRADLLIYLTDGRGPRPLKWKNIPLIWVFHLAGSQQTYLKSHHADWPGRKVYLEKPGF